MLFNRSTRAIVTGKKGGSTQPPSAGSDTVLKSDGTDTPKPFHEPKPKISKFSVNRSAIIFGIILTVAAVAVCFLIFCLLNDPHLDEGIFIAEVPAGSLASVAEKGDIVRLYDADGNAPPELRYVEVYGSSDTGILVLLDGMQADLLARQGSIRPILVCHNDPKRSKALLELETQIRNPEISLSLPESITLHPSEEKVLEFKISIAPEEAAYPEVTWETTDPSVATIENGTVTAGAVGDAVITARCGDVVKSCKIAVRIPMEGILLNQEHAILGVSETLQLEAVPSPADASDFYPVWSSSDTSIASVSDDGVVTGIGAGTAVITASSNGLDVTCSVTVGSRTEVVQLDHQSLSLKVGEQAVITPSIYPSSSIDPMLWESSNSGIAAVDENGTVTALAPGVIEILFTCGSQSAVCQVIVE